MLFYINLFFLAFIVSLDGFGVGVTYGLKKIRISTFALCIIVFCSSISILISTLIGEILISFITIKITKIIGSIILICIGFLYLRNNSISKKHNHQRLRVTLNNNEPKIISIKNAFILGFALSLDAFGVGISATMLEYPPILTISVISLMSSLMIYMGTHLGLFFSNYCWVKKVSSLPFFLLIFIALYNIIF